MTTKQIVAALETQGTLTKVRKGYIWKSRDWQTAKGMWWIGANRQQWGKCRETDKQLLLRIYNHPTRQL